MLDSKEKAEVIKRLLVSEDSGKGATPKLSYLRDFLQSDANRDSPMRFAERIDSVAISDEVTAALSEYPASLQHLDGAWVVQLRKQIKDEIEKNIITAEGKDSEERIQNAFAAGKKRIEELWNKFREIFAKHLEDFKKIEAFFKSSDISDAETLKIAAIKNKMLAIVKCSFTVSAVESKDHLPSFDSIVNALQSLHDFYQHSTTKDLMELAIGKESKTVVGTMSTILLSAASPFVKLITETAKALKGYKPTDVTGVPVVSIWQTMYDTCVQLAKHQDFDASAMDFMKRLRGFKNAVKPDRARHILSKNPLGCKTLSASLLKVLEEHSPADHKQHKEITPDFKGLLAKQKTLHDLKCSPDAPRV